MKTFECYVVKKVFLLYVHVDDKDCQNGELANIQSIQYPKRVSKYM